MQFMAQEAQTGQPVCSKDTIVQIEIRDTIATIDRAAWDRLCGASQFCRHDYMTALEASGLDCQHLYAVAMLHGELIGAAVATIWRLNLPGRFSLRVTTMGTPVNTGLALVQVPGAELRYELVKALELASVKQGVRIFVGRDFPTADYLEQVRLDKFYNCAYLALPWGDFEQYLAQLPKRKSVRRDIRALQKAGYVLEVREGKPLSKEEAQRLYQLWLQLYWKYRSPDQIMVTEAFFLQMSLLKHAVWLLLRKDGRIDAFDLCFVLGEQLESTYCGVDLAATGRLSVHRAMGYQIVRYALSRRLRSINFGISNEQGKLEMGCHLDPCYAWITANPRWLSRPLSLFMQRFVLEPDSRPGQGATEIPRVGGQ
ncbi:TPA: GNAT family N-acetyltransferase [Serratia fonticola]